MLTWLHHKQKWLLACVALGVGYGVFHAARIGSSQGPDVKDVHKAAREEELTTGAVDVRMPKPNAVNTLGAPGVVEPRDREVKVAPQVAGVVQAVLVEEGQTVLAGAPLVQLYADTERAALQAALGDLQAAQAQLQKTLHGARQEDIQAAEAEAKSAQARAKSSADSLARLEKLFAKQAVTEDELIRGRFQQDADAQTATALELRYAALANGSRPEDIAAAKAAVLQAQGRYQQAEAAVNRLLVTALHEGTVLQILVRPGEYVNPASGGVLNLGDTSVLRVRLDVDERDVARLQMNQRGYVQAEGYGDSQFPGKVVQIGKRMGRKNIRTDEPTERLDTKILEVVMELDNHPPFPQGLRVTGFLQ